MLSSSSLWSRCSSSSSRSRRLTSSSSCWPSRISRCSSLSRWCRCRGPSRWCRCRRPSRLHDYSQQRTLDTTLSRQPRELPHTLPDWRQWPPPWRPWQRISSQPWTALRCHSQGHQEVMLEQSRRPQLMKIFPLWSREAKIGGRGRPPQTEVAEETRRPLHLRRIKGGTSLHLEAGSVERIPLLEVPRVSGLAEVPGVQAQQAGGLNRRGDLGRRGGTPAQLPGPEVPWVEDAEVPDQATCRPPHRWAASEAETRRVYWEKRLCVHPDWDWGYYYFTVC